MARLTSILTQKLGSPALLNLGYSYYANGQVQQITNNLVTDGTQNEKYTYDDLLRLLTAHRGPDANIQRKYSYDYDRYGNRWGQNVVAGQGYNTQLGFDSVNNNNRVNSTGFSYDGSGNQTANNTGISFSYNPENFMAAAGASVSYTVGARGRRVRKNVSGTVTDYFYSGSAVISEKQGSSWTDYIFFGNQRIVKQTGSTASTASYLHPDHLGSTRVCTDANGNSSGTCDYEPFGEIRPGSTCGIPTNYRFAGMEFDSETGLYHTWFRQYDPTQGRWMSADPLAGDPDGPQTLDRYLYVLGDPVNLTDPLGLQSDCAFYLIRCDENERCYEQGYFCGLSGIEEFEMVEEEVSEILRNLAKIARKLKSALCKAMPEGRTTSLVGGIGGISGQTGTLTLLNNYNTGEVSLFVSGGLFAGWNGGIQGGVQTGFVSNLGDTNSNYSRWFTTFSGSVGVTGAYSSSSSQGLSGNPLAFNASGVREHGIGLSVPFIRSPFTATASSTYFSELHRFGRFGSAALTTPLDVLLTGLRQLCN